MVGTVNEMVRGLLEQLIHELKDDLGRLAAQRGHRLKGNLERSLEIRISRTSTGYIGEVWWLFYGNIVSEGVKSTRIPFTLGSGKKSSEFIDGLIDYFSDRGFADRKARNLAFITAIKQKEEGMSTRASAKNRFITRDGKRNQLVDDVLRFGESKINMAFDGFDLRILIDKADSILANVG